jgi:hypothetical protein
VLDEERIKKSSNFLRKEGVKVCMKWKEEPRSN